ncbi:hypothetical protein KBX50_05120 [Micromonospora sp. C51]|uniref:hypothetical protein n=1 Tax=Micromonospora sp. C51 TaxID=2824879 RepID=UPI001B380037|nr:hypothetical protein [Micromonospora sp. C51]MBQ1047839.1 hypothetical protein [Micromonospora sp. C51]
MPKLFGREPAIFLALAASVIKLLAAFVIDLSVDQQAVLNTVAAAVVGVLVAFIAVRDGQVAALLGLAQAALAAAVGFGLDMSAEDQAVLLSFVSVVLGMFERTQITAPMPADDVPTGEL